MKSAVQSANAVVFVPSSFDFIRVQNHFRSLVGNHAHCAFRVEASGKYHHGLDNSPLMQPLGILLTKISHERVKPSSPVTSHSCSSASGFTSLGGSLSRKNRLGSRAFSLHLFTSCRYKIRGIRNLIFYGPPDHPQFFSEFLSFPLLDDGVEASDITCRVLYSKYDFFRMERIVGTKEAVTMVSAI
jgi:U3 small nucleolar RNA-associated protein 25